MDGGINGGVGLDYNAFREKVDKEGVIHGLIRISGLTENPTSVETFMDLPSKTKDLDIMPSREGVVFF